MQIPILKYVSSFSDHNWPNKEPTQAQLKLNWAGNSRLKGPGFKWNFASKYTVYVFRIFVTEDHSKGSINMYAPNQSLP